MTTITTKYPFVGFFESKIGGRAENQDSVEFVDTPLGLLLVVCDGMGGGPAGKTASLTAVNTIIHHLEEVSATTPRDQALQFAVDKANEVIYSMAKDTPELRGMGTTVAAVIVNEQSAVIAHVGDSRIYLLRKGSVIYKSNDHSFVANLVRENKLTEEEARTHPRSNVITRALGIRPEVETEIDEIPFQRGDRFILCTDGIWGAMPQDELVKALSQVMGIAEMIAQVTEQVDILGQEAGGNHDNMTIAVLDTTFDSSVKKVKKNDPVTSTANEVEPPRQHRKRFRLLEIILMLIAMALIAALAVYVYKSFNANKDRHPTPKVIVDEAKSKGGQQADSETETPQLANPQSEPVEEMPLDGKVAKDIRGKIGNLQIGTIINHLDHLKQLEGTDRTNLRNIKKQYVKENILPDLDRLEKKMGEKNKQIFDEIRIMLADKKTTNAGANGKSTAESNEYIDQIKERLKKLQQ